MVTVDTTNAKDSMERSRVQSVRTFHLRKLRKSLRLHVSELVEHEITYHQEAHKRTINQRNFFIRLCIARH